MIPRGKPCEVLGRDTVGTLALFTLAFILGIFQFLHLTPFPLAGARMDLILHILVGMVLSIIQFQVLGASGQARGGRYRQGLGSDVLCLILMK